MKLNKNKIIVSALALAIGTSLAGSIGSTIAWYQYSTRANVSFLGQSSGISGNLQMRFEGEADTAWRTRITKEELATKLGTKGTELKPMTFGGVKLNEELPEKGYVQPKAGVQNMTSWFEAKEENYAQFTLELRYIKRDGVEENSKDEKDVQKQVFLTKLFVQEDHNNDEGHDREDISNAVRVHIASSYVDNGAKKDYKLISNEGGSTVTHGKLDLDGDGKADTYFPDNDEFGFEHTDAQLVEADYGDVKIQTTLKADKDGGDHSYFNENDTETQETVYPALVDSEADSYNLKETAKQTIPNVGDVEKYIGKTNDDQAGSYLKVTVTVWVEGWHRFDYSARTGNPKFDAIWDANLVDAKFDLGIQFAVDEIEND